MGEARPVRRHLRWPAPDPSGSRPSSGAGTRCPALPRRTPRRIVRKAFDGRRPRSLRPLRRRAHRCRVDRPGAPGRAARRSRGRGEDPPSRAAPALRGRHPCDGGRCACGREGAARSLAPATYRASCDLFAQLVLEELDFRIEALNMVELGITAEHAGADYVRFPRPIPELVTERVLVMERLPGVSYANADPAGLEAGAPPHLGDQGVLEHTLVYGVFHGDLHAGNVLLDGDGYVLPRRLRHRRPPRRAAALGPRSVPHRLRSDGRAISARGDGDVRRDARRPGSRRPHRRDRGEVDPGSLSEESGVDELADAIGRLIRVLSRHGIRLPKELVLFFKNLLYLNGFAAIGGAGCGPARSGRAGVRLLPRQVRPRRGLRRARPLITATVERCRAHATALVGLSRHAEHVDAGVHRR